MPENNIGLEERVSFKAIKEEWSEYKLQDGTLLKVKPVVVDVIKTDKKDPYGFPIYIVKTATVTAVNSPLPGKEKGNE